MNLSYLKFVSLTDKTNTENEAHANLKKEKRTCLESIGTCRKILKKHGHEEVEIKIDLDSKKLWIQTSGVCPVHVCSPQDVEVRSQTTHHYCGIFSDIFLAAPQDILYVMMDGSHAEEVNLNRERRILMTSFDGNLSVWGLYYTFRSENFYAAGTPIRNASGELVSVVTCRTGCDYAVSSFDKDFGGFMETNLSPLILEQQPGIYYGGTFFDSREDLKAYIKGLKHTFSCEGSRMVALYGAMPRVSHVCQCGRQLSTIYCGVNQAQPEYL